MQKFCVLLIVSFMSSALNYNVFAAEIVTDGLVSYWTFDLHHINDGIVEDVWGENDAEIVGKPIIGAGYLRQGLVFRGLKDYVILSNLGNLQSRIAPSSIELWFKLTDHQSISTLFKVIEAPCDSLNHGWGIDLKAALRPQNIGQAFNPELDGNPDNLIYSENGIFVNTTEIGLIRRCDPSVFSVQTEISDQEWHHLVYVTGARYIDESGVMWKENYLYIDNIRLKMSTSRPTNPDNLVSYTQPVYLGATNYNGNPRKYYYRGSIDEVRVYNRAITHAEVTQNFIAKDSLFVEANHKLPIVWGKLKQRR